MSDADSVTGATPSPAVSDHGTQRASASADTDARSDRAIDTPAPSDSSPVAAEASTTPPPRSHESQKTGETTSYPHQWEADVVLRDGSLARVRPIAPADAPAVHRFHDAQSEESVYLRFFAPIKHLSDKDVHRFTHVDHDARVALVALVGDEIIGIARYDRLDDRSVAEVAFNISDHYHGKGVGSVLLEHLAAIATEAGVREFVADVLPQNRKMMKVFTDAGYAVDHHFDDGVISVSFQIAPTDESQAVQLAREHRAEAESITRVLTPESIAVVGVSRRPEAVGSVVFDNIVDRGYAGRVYPVHSEVSELRGLKTFRRVSDIDERVDLVVIAVPAEAVLDIVDDCGAAGVRTLLVVSSGFAESGSEGERRQAELLRRARAFGIRVVGPNSLGVVNNHPGVLLDATSVRQTPEPGILGLFAQSGGVGVGLLQQVRQRGLGVSVFASAGNRVDVSGNDVMQFWIDDDDTKVVALFLESVGNPRKFSRIARQLSLRKPVVCLKSGTAGQVPPGHRARATRVGSAAFDAMLTQAGVVQARTTGDLIDIGEMFAHQPLPAGPRVAVLGNSPGLNAIVADEAARAGLDVARGPVELPWDVDAREVARALEEAFADPGVDSVAVCFASPLGSAEEEVAAALAHVAWGYDKPCVSAFLGTRDVRAVMRRTGKPVGGNDQHRRIVPVHDDPVHLVTVLAAVTRYAQWRAGDHGERVRPPGLDRPAAVQLVDEVLATSPQGRRLTRDETSKLLGAYGIEVWRTEPAPDADAAVAAARELGYPVVLRSLAESVRQRPDAGAVRTHLGSDAAVREAFAALTEHLGACADPELAVQRMGGMGIATRLESTEDPLFGPVVTFGLAGPASELLGDVVHRIPPLTDVDVRSLLTSLAGAPLLHGYRGAEPVAVTALEDIVLRVAVLADEVPEVASLVLPHLNAHAGGVDVLDAVAEVAPATARKDAGRRAMT